jgi:transmembrane sensor
MSPPPATHAPVAPEVAEQAVRWLVDLRGGTASESQRAAWVQWRRENPEHERAWQHIEEVNRRLQGAPGALARAVIGAPAKAGRRRALKLLVLVAAGGASTWTARDAAWVREWTADYRTRPGERLRVALADGSSVMLNGDSALDVSYDGSQRTLRLLRGEILVATAPDLGAAPRPFAVETRHGRLRALGTRFNVRLDSAGTSVAVFDGAVELRPAQRPDPPLVVGAGEQAVLTHTGYGRPAPLEEGAGAWVDGMLVAVGMPLERFLAELSRQRPGRLGCAPEIAQLRVSGTYPLADTDRVLAALERALPVQVKTFTRYWVSVVPRPAT